MTDPIEAAARALWEFERKRAVDAPPLWGALAPEIQDTFRDAAELAIAAYERAKKQASHRYYARSASSGNEEWPYWMVLDSQRGGLNVSGDLVQKVLGRDPGNTAFVTRPIAEKLAAEANEKGIDL